MLPLMASESTDSTGAVACLRQLLEPRDEILEAYLFGSVARGQAQKHSDLDVAVYVDKGRCGGAPFGYSAQLTTALMAGLGFNDVDVVVLNHAPPLLYHRVLRDGIRVLSRDLRATTTREATALSRYCDFIPHLDRLRQAVAPSASPEAER